MEKEFVPYQPSLDLKELGFDEPCFATIDQTEFLHINGTKKLPRGSMMYDTIDCPTFSQAFRWFREKYGLFAEITLWGDGLGYISMIKEIKQEEFIEVYKKDIVDTGLPIWKYEEAELECLKKLIEIVKEKK